MGECETGLDYWLYTLKYMEKLETLPFKGQKALFERLEKLAKIVNLNKKEREEYEECLKVYRDNKNVWDYALKSGFNEGRELGRELGREEGRELGREEAMYQVARSMKERGIDPTSIIACTGLAAEVVAAL